jgi:hypothetical protein
MGKRKEMGVRDGERGRRTVDTMAASRRVD